MQFLPTTGSRLMRAAAIMLLCSGAIVLATPVAVPDANIDTAPPTPTVFPPFPTPQAGIILGNLVPEEEAARLTELYLPNISDVSVFSAAKRETGTLGRRSYLASCTACVMPDNGWVLYCACYTMAQTLTWTNIHVGTYIGNDNSALTWVGSNAHLSCYSPVYNGGYLAAHCNDQYGHTDIYGSSIWLDAHFHNWNGILAYAW